MALDDTPNKLESVWIQRNPLNQFYEQINISGSDLIIYHSSSGEIMADKISVWAGKYGIGTGGGGTTVKVSATDTTPGYLSGSKLFPGNNVSFSIQNLGGNETLLIHSLGGATSDSSSWASSSLTTSYVPYNGNRAITRNDPVWQGVIPGGDDVVEFLDKFFYPFNPATISINSGVTYYETGSSQTVSMNGIVTANSETVFGSGSVRRSGSDWYTFTSASSYSTSDTGVTGSRTYRTFMQTGNNGSPTLINSSTKTATFLYPYLYGMSTTPGLTGSALYAVCAKLKQLETSPITVSFTGAAVYMYFCYPVGYTQIVKVLDPNLFNISTAFEHSASVAITSSGLSTNWMEHYQVDRMTLLSSPNGNFVFSNTP